MFEAALILYQHRKHSLLQQKMEPENPFDVDDDFFSQTVDMLDVDIGILDEGIPKSNVATTPQENHVDMSQEFIECEDPMDIPGPAGRRIPKASRLTGEGAWGDKDFSSTKSLAKIYNAIAKEMFSASPAWDNLVKDIPFPQEQTIADISDLKETQKVKRVIAIVTSMIQIHRSGYAVLSDPSGTIKAVIHEKVLNHYSEMLEPGSALVLKDISLLVTSTEKCLNVTKRNIEQVYALPERM